LTIDFFKTVTFFVNPELDFLFMQPHNITVLVVDDDPPSRQTLEIHLASIPGIRILPSASGVKEALDFKVAASMVKGI